MYPYMNHVNITEWCRCICLDEYTDIIQINDVSEHPNSLLRSHDFKVFISVHSDFKIHFYVLNIVLVKTFVTVLSEVRLLRLNEVGGWEFGVLSCKIYKKLSSKTIFLVIDARDKSTKDLPLSLNTAFVKRTATYFLQKIMALKRALLLYYSVKLHIEKIITTDLNYNYMIE